MSYWILWIERGEKDGVGKGRNRKEENREKEGSLLGLIVTFAPVISRLMERIVFYFQLT